MHRLLSTTNTHATTGVRVRAPLSCLRLLHPESSVRLVILCILTLLLGFSLSSCTAPDSKTRVERRYAVHSFEFDARSDSPDIEILDFQYGVSNFHGVRGCPRQHVKCIKTPQYSHTYGDMEVGDHLYVKWRIRSSDKIFEEMVDLRKRLPMVMTDKSIYFAIDGSQLYVFLVGSKKLDRNQCPSWAEQVTLAKSPHTLDRVLSMFCYLPLTTLYPEKSAI